MTSGVSRPHARDGVWLFGPEEAPVRVAGADLLLAHLPVFLGGWPMRWCAEPGDADIAVREEPGGRFMVERFGPGGGAHSFDDPLDAAEALAGALIHVFIAARPDHVCLRAGSAQVGRGLVVLIGGPLAGKSSVALQLAAMGCRLYGDDRLAPRLCADGPPVGVCLGLMPKLALPLPEEAGSLLAEFVDSYAEIRSDSAVHLRPWDTEAATFGESAPLAALVVLERGGEAPAALTPAPAGDIARALVASALAPGLSAEALSAAMTGLAGAFPGYRLRWMQSAAAARAISGAISGRGTGQ
jgi:hypothetical protein